MLVALRGIECPLLCTPPRTIAKRSCDLRLSVRQIRHAVYSLAMSAQWPGKRENSAIGMGDDHMGQPQSSTFGVLAFGVIAAMLCTAAGRAADSLTIAS